MYFREPTEDKPLRIRDNPMHRSHISKSREQFGERDHPWIH